jgi:hypothetical protein
MSDYAKSTGAVFAGKKTHEKMPDYVGRLEVTKEQIKELVELGRQGHPIELRLAMWDRKSKESGKPYKYISAEPNKPRQAAPMDEDLDF